MRRPEAAQAGPLRIQGIGIDLVDKKRVQKLIQQNPRPAVRALFTKLETQKIKFTSPRQFARLFAAKEAFFKAVGGVWLGLENFPKIKVHCFTKDCFQVESPIYKVSPRHGVFAEGQFFECGTLVGAQVLVWSLGMPQ